MENSTKNTEKSSIKIAVTSQNYRTVTKHAGLTRKVLVYDVQCSEDGKIKIEEMKDARIKLPKDMALNTCKQGVEHPIDIADVLVSGSCGEEFISNMARRGIIVSVTEKTDPVEAVKEFLENGTEHFTCDGPHQIKIKRHPNCLHNKKHKHEHKHNHKHKHKQANKHGCGCNHGHGNGNGHNHKHGQKCGCGSDELCHGKE